VETSPLFYINNEQFFHLKNLIPTNSCTVSNINQKLKLLAFDQEE